MKEKIFDLIKHYEEELAILNSQVSEKDIAKASNKSMTIGATMGSIDIYEVVLGDLKKIGK